jgi:hypothetical protein
LYFFSGADTAFRGVEVEVEVDGSEVAVAISADAAGMTAAISSYSVASMNKVLQPRASLRSIVRWSKGSIVVHVEGRG